MNLIDKAKDKLQRHSERHTPLGYQYTFSDSVGFLNIHHWDQISEDKSIFLSRNYLKAIEEYSPENSCQRYAIAYSDGKPVLILACQLADINGEQLSSTDDKLTQSIASNYNDRVLVCGNLVSSGLHGIAFSSEIDDETGWKIAAEILYKIRRAEKLSGEINFSVIKDIPAEVIERSSIIERFSYRRIQTDPNMVLTLGNEVNDFESYLQLLSSKYRSRVKKVKKTIEKAGLECKKLTIDEKTDEIIHTLYLNVENRAKTRLSTLPKGYFKGLADNLGDNFSCYGILREGTILGFISVINDNRSAIAYYVGFDYQENENHPLYFRLLQLVIDAAIEMNCTEVHFGRSALEPKASLGAKPQDVYVWARHRVPVVNFFVRKLFRNIPFDEAPERNSLKNPDK